MTALHLYLVVWGVTDWAFPVWGSNSTYNIDLCDCSCILAQLSPPRYLRLVFLHFSIRSWFHCFGSRTVSASGSGWRTRACGREQRAMNRKSFLRWTSSGIRKLRVSFFSWPIPIMQDSCIHKNFQSPAAQVWGQVRHKVQVCHL